MNDFVKHIVRFIVLILIQTLFLNQLEIGWGIQFMIYPLFIMLLPFEMATIPMLLLAFAMGMSIDGISNTYGLHTSSLLLVTYMRPGVFKLFSPRDGYDNLKEGTSFQMGARWFISVFGSLLLAHHFFFFTLEIFRFAEIMFILQKTLVSLPFSFLLSMLLQALFVSKPKER
jgi:hypothetical protein